jgi:putative nucleotidyltransferase with HDIG domain
MKTLLGRWLSLRTEIILPYMLLALLLAIGAAYVGTRVVFDSIEERFVNQLIDAGKLASEWMVREENRLLATQRVLAYTEGVQEGIQAENAERLRELIYPIVVNSQEEAVDILDLQGVTAVSLHHRPGGNIEDYEFSRGDTTFQQLPFVQKVLQRQSDGEGDKYAGIVSIKQGEYLYVSGPIFDTKGNFVGVVLVGKSLKTLVRQIREATLSQVTIYNPSGRAIATTFLEAQALDNVLATNILNQKETRSLVRDLVASDIDYREVLGAWQVRHHTDLGLIGVSFAKNFLVRVGQNTWLQVLLSILIAFLLVALIGVFVSDRISRPILNLGQAASLVADGDLTIQVAPTGNDEITLLIQKFNQMVTNLAHTKSDLVSAYDTTLEGWVKALDLRDEETTGHSLRVAELTVKLARALAITDMDLGNIRRGALLHDIGKMAIPDTILRKPGPLTEDEWRVMRQHPGFAVQMLQGIAFLRIATTIPANHHEKWDGSGYPRNLKGEAIPIAARIFAVVDAWDSLLSDRPYRRAVPEEQARRVLQESAGTCFDPMVVQAVFKMLDEDYNR